MKKSTVILYGLADKESTDAGNNSYYHVTNNTLYFDTTPTTWKYMYMPLLSRIPIRTGDVVKVSATASANANAYSGMGFVSNRLIWFTQNEIVNSFSSYPYTAESDMEITQLVYFVRTGSIPANAYINFHLYINDVQYF